MFYFIRLFCVLCTVVLYCAIWSYGYKVEKTPLILQYDEPVTLPDVTTRGGVLGVAETYKVCQ